MKSSVENISPTRVRLVVEVAPDDLQPAVEAAFKKIAEQVNIPGFRRGKVPARIIEQRFGRGVVLEEALNEAVPSAYEAALAEHGVQALGQPELKIDQDLSELGDGDAVEFTAEVDVRPEIDLPDYKGRPVQVDDVEVTDADVTEQLDELRSRFASVNPVERAVEDGDLVVVDVEGAIDGERQEEFSGTAMTFAVGEGQMIEGFDEAIRGAETGDTVTFDYQGSEGDIDGKTVNLTLTVKAVRERELPEADDDFAQLASEFDTIDELQDDLRERIGRVRLVEQGMQARDKLAAGLLEELDIPVPQGVVDQLVEQHFADGHGDEAHREEFVAETTQSLRQQFLLDAIADTEEIEVSQDDIGQWVVQQAPRYNMTPDQFIQALLQADQLSSAIGDVRRGKALSVVLESAQITDASGREVDLSILDRDEDQAEEALEELEGDIDEVAAEIEADEEAEAAAAAPDSDAEPDRAEDASK